MAVRRWSVRLGTRLARVGVLAALAATSMAPEAKGSGKPLSKAAMALSVARASATQAGYKTLDRNAHPRAQPDHEVGRLDPSKRLGSLSIAFKPTAAQVADREALLEAIQDPSSPNYHKWLTPEQIATRFGANPADIARMSQWLASQGFEVGRTSRLANRLNFAGTVAQFEQAFATEMHQYKYGTEVHYAMASAPMMPADLADLTLTVHNAHNFFAKPAGHLVKAPQAACPTGSSYCQGNGLGPTDWANLYDVSSLYTTGIGGKAVDGTGVTIAIVGVAQIDQADITAFHTAFPPAAGSVTTTLVPGTGVSQGDNGAGGEAFLDVEWAGGIAKGATINFVLAGADSGNPDDAAYYAIEENLAPILSESFGGAEAYYAGSEADLIQVNGAAASLMGITYLAASGDCGAATGERAPDIAAGLWVSLPAAYPGITAVGGTQFGTSDTAGTNLTFSGSPPTVQSYPTSATAESVWNEQNNPNATYQGQPEGLGSGGGGISTYFTLPSYQTGLACTPVGTLPPGASATGMRLVPDVAFVAASGLPGYFIECTMDSSTGDCSGTGGTPTVLQYGGTSASTPSFAGVVALIIEAAAQATSQTVGTMRLGNINPLLYQMEKGTSSPFHDITAGNNEIMCTVGTDQGCGTAGLYGYAAATGYDCASGLGSLDVKKLVTAWAALTPSTTTLAASPTSTTEGAKVALTATVAATKGTLAGTVTFSFQSYSANGTPDLSWALGSAAVSGGTATLSTAIPPGLVDPGAQYVDVVAEYGGDSTHLASTSTKSRVTFAVPAFLVCPGTASVAANATVSFKATGGIGATYWQLYRDTACLPDGGDCSSIDDAGVLVTTAAPSYILLGAYDTDFAETYMEITVGAPTGATPWAGDAGLLPSACAAPPATDAGVKDAASGDSHVGPVGQPDSSVGPTGNDASSDANGTSTGTDGSISGDGGPIGPGPTAKSSGGGGCATAPNSGSPFTALAGLALAVGLAFRRRRSS